MADIKAKDISVAQSVGASDLILGSSIAGTTANVRVDTLGNYLINDLPFATIGNASVSSNISRIKDSIRNIQTRNSILYQRQSSSSDVFEYMDISFTVPNNHIYILEAQGDYNYARCDGIGLSGSNTSFDPLVWNEHMNARKSGTCILFGPYTVYVWSKRHLWATQGKDKYYINYVDLGEINSI